MGPWRKALDDGRVVIVEPFDDDKWIVAIQDDAYLTGAGFPLAATIADVVGYRVGFDEWPDWIDVWAAEIVAEARAEGIDAARDP